MEKVKAAYEIGVDSALRSQAIAPNQYIPEIEKTPDWYYKNLNYILGFYNQPVAPIESFSSTTTTSTGSSNINTDRRNYPVQFMLRMMSYYLGEQPNMNYNHLVPNVATTNLQAQWIKGQDVSEFVMYFKGLIMQKVSNLTFNAKSMSREASSKRDEYYNALMLKFDLKPMFEEMAKGGVSFNPEENTPIEMKEDAEKWMETNYKEYGAIVATQLANGLWFSNEWVHKVLQSFMYVVVTSTCAMEHYVSNGMTHQEIILPYQLIVDNRYDNDFGKQDQFIGYVKSMTPTEIFSDSRFVLSNEQKLDIQEMAQRGEIGSKYNDLSTNILWWNYNGTQNNSVTVATVYFRGLRDTGKKKEKSIIGKEYIAEGKYGEDGVYQVQDIYKATLIGNKYLTNYGLIDNLVEDIYDKSKPCLPIIRYRPNTFGGQSKSEVAKIFKLQDNMDMLAFKINEMIGKAKGKVYIISDKYAQSLPKEFVEDISTIGVHFAQTASEFKDQQARERGVELLDWTLDPNIGQLINYYRENKDRMGKNLSATDIARGQNTKYTGLGVLQGTINQNSFGTAYLIDGFMDWIVMNMRYAVNQSKNLYAKTGKSNMQMLIGDRGIKYLEVTKDLLFEDIWVELVVNNIMDEKERERTLAIAQADAQNGKLGVLDWVKLSHFKSSVEMEEYFEYKDKKNSQKNDEAQMQMKQFEAQMEQMKKQFEVQLEQLKEDNANFRAIYTANMQAVTKGYTELLKNPPIPPTPATINQPQSTDNNTII